MKRRKLLEVLAGAALTLRTSLGRAQSLPQDVAPRREAKKRNQVSTTISSLREWNDARLAHDYGPNSSSPAHPAFWKYKEDQEGDRRKVRLALEDRRLDQQKVRASLLGMKDGAFRVGLEGEPL